VCGSKGKGHHFFCCLTYFIQLERQRSQFVKQGSPIFRMERSSYSTRQSASRLREGVLPGRSRPLRDTPGPKVFATSQPLTTHPASLTALEKPLSLPPEIAVERQRPGTADDEGREASKIEQVTLVARWSELGMAGGHTQQLD
jgi:hypothetical protein